MVFSKRRHEIKEYLQFSEAPEFITLIGEAQWSYILYLGMYEKLKLQLSEAPEYTIQLFSEAQRWNSCSDSGMNKQKKNIQCEYKMMESLIPTRIVSLDVKECWNTIVRHSNTRNQKVRYRNCRIMLVRHRKIAKRQNRKLRFQMHKMRHVG